VQPLVAFVEALTGSLPQAYAHARTHTHANTPTNRASDMPQCIQVGSLFIVRFVVVNQYNQQMAQTERLVGIVEPCAEGLHFCQSQCVEASVWVWVWVWVWVCV